MQFLLYAAELAATDYYVRSLRFDHVWSGRLFAFPSHFVEVLSNFGFYKTTERMRMDPVPVVLALHRMTEVD